MDFFTQLWTKYSVLCIVWQGNGWFRIRNNCLCKGNIDNRHPNPVTYSTQYVEKKLATVCKCTINRMNGYQKRFRLKWRKTLSICSVLFCSFFSFFFVSNAQYIHFGATKCMPIGNHGLINKINKCAVHVCVAVDYILYVATVLCQIKQNEHCYNLIGNG